MAVGSVFIICGQQELLQRSKRIDLSIWGEGEGLSEAWGEETAGIYGVSESVGGIWGAVCEGQPASLQIFY